MNCWGLPRSLRSVACAPNYGAKEKTGNSGRDDRAGGVQVFRKGWGGIRWRERDERDECIDTGGE